jgi:hypothetical protein
MRFLATSTAGLELELELELDQKAPHGEILIAFMIGG